MTTEIQNLFKDVSAVSQKYKAEIEQSGERFNIFKILDRTTDEVKTHSAFVATLLRPNGTHGKGTLFLKSFVELLKAKSESDIDFDIESAEVFVEYSIGQTTATTGGRIDILVQDKKGRKIIIENKIYAGEQANQLLRYYNFDNNSTLVYLTLGGEKPNSIGKDKKVICISYKENIVSWLETCLADTDKHIYGTIYQYINLIKYLTNQTINSNMKKEIVNAIITNEENLSVAFNIAGSIGGVKQLLLDDFAKRLKEKVESDNIKVEIESKQKRAIGTCLYFVKGSQKVRLLTVSNYVEFYLDIMTEAHDKKDKNAMASYQEELNVKSQEWGRLEDMNKGWGHSNWGIKLNLLNSDSAEKWKELLPNNVDETVNNVSGYVFALFEAINKYESLTKH